MSVYYYCMLQVGQNVWRVTLGLLTPVVHSSTAAPSWPLSFAHIFCVPCFFRLAWINALCSLTSLLVKLCSIAIFPLCISKLILTFIVDDPYSKYSTDFSIGLEVQSRKFMCLWAISTTCLFCFIFKDCLLVTDHGNLITQIKTSDSHFQRCQICRQL